MAEQSRSHEQCLCVNLAVVPECGEDSFAFHMDAKSGFLCVADGCGGLGARRYERVREHTGAYLAARIVTKCVKQWARGRTIPKTAEEGRILSGALSERLAIEIERFEAAHGGGRDARVVGSMRRTLPTTLCMSLFEIVSPNALDCFFLWAGDSRGYVLNAEGLHQLTADHTEAAADAWDALYKDAALRNMINGDKPFVISGRKLRVERPCLVITATDGAFAYLPTPMEFEWLLLSTLQTSANAERWQKKLAHILKGVTSDDCTILISMVGYESFGELKWSLEGRHKQLQYEYITPVRRRRMKWEYARAKWDAYRKDYDWTEGVAHEILDWRI